MSVFSVDRLKKISAVSLFGLFSFASTTLAAGEPIASYNFNQGSGTVLNDISGNGNAGTLVSSPTWGVGKNSGGLSFNGSTSYVSMGDVNALDGLTRITVGGWIKTTASGEKHIVDKSQCDGVTNGGPFELGTGFFSTGKATFLVYKNGGGYYYVQSANNVNDGAWHYITGVYDGTNLLIYVDGVQSGQLSLPGITLSSNTNSLELGGRCNGNAYIWNGSVDDVRIYNRALTAGEIVTDMNTPVGQAATPDTTAPTVSLTAPLNNATVSGSAVTVSANAADNIAVAGVQFLLDGNSLGVEDTTSPYSVVWDTTATSTGSHTLSARARDAAGNTASASDVTVTVVPLPGAVLGYALNEGTGTVATDSTGTGNTGTLINGPVWASGKNGGGLQFDGTNDYIDAPHTSSVNITGNKISLSAWVNPNIVTGTRMIVGKPVSATAHTSPYFSYALYANANKVVFYLRTGTTNRTLTTTQTLNLNAWNYVTAVYNGATMKIYLDGVERATLNATGNLASYTTPLRFGANGAKQQVWSGLLDDVRVYDRDLSVSEIQRDMNTPVAPTGVDTTAPVLTQVTAVATPTSDNTPNYTFSSSEAGTIVYGGACSSATVNAVSGNNTITFASLADGTLSNCTVQVSDAAGNQSNVLNIPSFTVDTLAPTVLSVSSDTPAGTYAVGQVIDIDVTFSEAVTSTGNSTVTLETGTNDRTCTFTLTNATAGTCNYTVQAGDMSSDLDTNALAGTIKDQAGNVLTNFVPATTLATNEAIVIDTTPPADNSAPSVPTNLTATVISSSQVNLSWTASTDNIAVTGYRVYRDGTQVGSAAGVTYADSGLAASTLYTYTVAAFDAAGNLSAETAGVSATTLTPTTAPNLVAAYNFDEASGTALIDRTTNANNGTLTNGPVWGVGKNSGGLSFDGANDYVQAPNSSSLNITGSALTLEAWIKPSDGSSDSVILGKPYTDGTQNSPYYQYGLEIDRNGGDQIDLLLATGTATLNVFSFSRPVVYGQWNHVAVTYDGSMIRGYLNGTAAGSQAASGAIASRTTPLRFGVDATLSQPYQGVLDDVRLYSRALSATEIAADMTTPVGGAAAPDTTAPTITSVSSDAPAGTYAAGQTIDIDVTFSEAVTSTGAVTVTLETGTVDQTCTFTLVNANMGTCNYVVQAGDSSLDLDVNSIAGDIKDQSGNALADFVPGTSLSANEAIVIDTTPDTTAPSVPTNLTVSPASNTQLNLSWTAATDNIGVAAYEIFRDGVSLATVTAPTVGYQNTGLTPATTYTYTVRAKDTAGNNSAQTAGVQGTTPASSPLTSYTTSFDSTENPISESGNWTHNPNNPWQKVRTTGGNALPAAYTEVFDDAYAYLGNWAGGDDYDVQGTVYWPTGIAAGEVELLLRASDTDTQVKTYEVFFNQGGSWQLVRWNGPLGDYTVINEGGGIGYPLNGAQVRATIVGSLITVYSRPNSGASWTTLGSATDTTLTTGKPGISFYAHAADGNLNTVGFSDYSVTQISAPDTTAPTGSITAPSAGATVSGTTTTVSATASDNVAVASVQFKLDGSNLGGADTSSPYSITWNTTTATNAPHTLTALITDTAGNTTTTSGISVTVNNVVSLSYSTTFPLTESPMVEDGGWENGGVTASDFQNVQTGGGNAYGTGITTNSYDDNVAARTGWNNSYQEITATVYRAPGYSPSGNHEIELVSGVNMGPNSIRLYEWLINTHGGIQFARWNGPVGDFDVSLPTTGIGLNREPVDGDVFKVIYDAKTNPNAVTVKLYLNDVLIGTGTDSTSGRILSGNPGLSFFIRPGATVENYGFKDWSAVGTP